MIERSCFTSHFVFILKYENSSYFDRYEVIVSGDILLSFCERLGDWRQLGRNGATEARFCLYRWSKKGEETEGGDR